MVLLVWVLLVLLLLPLFLLAERDRLRLLVQFSWLKVGTLHLARLTLVPLIIILRAIVFFLNLPAYMPIGNTPGSGSE